MKRLLGGTCVVLTFAPLVYLVHLASLHSGQRVVGGITRTLAMSAVIAITVAVLATGLGFISSRHVAASKDRGAWTIAAYLPFVISPIVFGTLLLHVFLVTGLAGTVTGVILAQLIVAHGLAVVLLTGFWTPHTEELGGVAKTLGATPWQTWSRVLVPAARPMLQLCFFQTFVLAWMQYGVTLLIGTGQVKTLPLVVFDYVTEADPSLGAVAALALIVPPLLFWRLEAHATR